MRTDAQVNASRENGKQGGVRTPEGKAVSRFNARKHGIFASSFSEQDREELRSVHDELAATLQPLGPLEDMLVEKMAMVYLRWHRCACAEAAYHTMVWGDSPEPDAKQGAVIVPRKVRRVFDPRLFERVMPLLWRYDTTLTNQFLRSLHEFERLQRMRAGEELAAPLVGDLFLHGAVNPAEMGGSRPVRGADSQKAKLQNEPKQSQVPAQQGVKCP